MTEAEIFILIKKNIKDVLPNVKDEGIKTDLSLRDLGANSIDRSDIAIKSMADLNLKIPLIELAKANNIQGLIDLFYKNLNEST